MVERSEESIIAAEYVHQLAATEPLLADASLAAIDPLISEFIVTDTCDEYFGHIIEPPIAEEYAYYQEKVRSDLFEQAARRLNFMEHGGYNDPAVTAESLVESAAEQANEDTNTVIAQTFYDIALMQGYAKLWADKVADDARITLGEIDSMNQRTREIMSDVRAQKRGPFAAFRAALVLQRRMKQAQKEHQRKLTNTY